MQVQVHKLKIKWRFFAFGVGGGEISMYVGETPTKISKYSEVIVS